MSEKKQYTDIDFDQIPPTFNEADNLRILDEVDQRFEELAESLPLPPVEFLTGAAGTGKTFRIREQIKDNPRYGMLCATTGIAAVNLDTVTLNSVLKYFDTDSLESNYMEGKLQKQLRLLRDQNYRFLIIDEVSMLSARQLELIYKGLTEIAQHGKIPLGLVLTGDFCQLPPVKAPFAFLADCWPKFAANTTRLTKNYRQTDERFLQAMSFLRAGDGQNAVDILVSLGVKFHPTPDVNFLGTTLHAKNQVVDRFNDLRLSAKSGEKLVVRSHRWGKQKSEWDPHKGNIPEKLYLKLGALVMMLANLPNLDDPDKYDYVNGDLGTVEDFDPLSGIDGRGSFSVKILRTGQTHLINLIHRTIMDRELPLDMLHADVWDGHGGIPNGPFWDDKRRKWHIGGVLYYPMRLAYASSVHKSQGLTLDRIQVDIKDHFMSQPGMVYVALSRCRTAEGLRIVGDPDQMVRRVKTDEQVKRWL